MQAQEPDEIARRVLSSLGFPGDRVDKALACLAGESSHMDADLFRLLTFREVQTMLGVSKSSLRRIIDRGRLAPVHITPRRIGFASGDVAAFLKSLS